MNPPHDASTSGQTIVQQNTMQASLMRQLNMLTYLRPCLIYKRAEVHGVPWCRSLWRYLLRHRRGLKATVLRWHCSRVVLLTANAHLHSRPEPSAAPQASSSTTAKVPTDLLPYIRSVCASGRPRCGIQNAGVRSRGAGHCMLCITPTLLHPCTTASVLLKTISSTVRH